MTVQKWESAGNIFMYCLTAMRYGRGILCVRYRKGSRAEAAEVLVSGSDSSSDNETEREEEEEQE